MDYFKWFGGSEDKKEDKMPENINKSMYVPSSREKKKPSPSKVKEDPGPSNVKIVSSNKTVVKTVTDNKRRIDDKMKLLLTDKSSKLEETLLKKGNFSKKEEAIFEIPTEEFLNDMRRVDRNQEIEVIKEATKYLYEKKVILERIEKSEEGLNFRNNNQIKHESELVKHLMENANKKTEECRQLQEQLLVLTKEKNKAQEEFSRINVDLDTKLKKISELNFANNGLTEKLKEYQKKTSQLMNSLEEIRRMNAHEQSTAVREIGRLKNENKDLLERLEREENERKRLEKENENMQRELAIARVDDHSKVEKPQSISTQKCSPAKLNESTHVSVDNTINFKVSKLIVAMLEPRDIAMLLASSKKVFETLSVNRITWTNVIKGISKRAKDSIFALNSKIDLLRNDDRRFAFLKSTEISADEEIKKIIDEYICKRKRLGESIVKVVQECKSFIQYGEVQDLKKLKQDASGSGLFGAIGGMIGWGSSTASAKADTVIEDDPMLILAGVISSERTTTPEMIFAALTSTAKKFASQHEKMSKWISTLQRYFGILYKTILYFYLEARDVEKLKDFLTDRFETYKDKVKIMKDENVKLLEQSKDQTNLRIEMTKTIKDLNTQIVEFNAKCTANMLRIAKQEKELKETKESQAMEIDELTHKKKVLINEVKLLRKKVSDAEKGNAEFQRGIEELKELIDMTKEACQDITLKSD